MIPFHQNLALGHVITVREIIPVCFQTAKKDHRKGIVVQVGNSYFFFFYFIEFYFFSLFRIREMNSYKVISLLSNQERVITGRP